MYEKEFENFVKWHEARNQTIGTVGSPIGGLCDINAKSLRNPTQPPKPQTVMGNLIGISQENNQRMGNLVARLGQIADKALGCVPEPPIQGEELKPINSSDTETIANNLHTNCKLIGTLQTIVERLEQL